jgi:hypothetical protein
MKIFNPEEREEFYVIVQVPSQEGCIKINYESESGNDGGDAASARCRDILPISERSELTSAASELWLIVHDRSDARPQGLRLIGFISTRH